MNTELPTAGRSRLVASDRTDQPWTTLIPDSSRLLHRYRFRLSSAIRPNKVPPSRCQGWRSLTRPRVEEFEVATGARKADIFRRPYLVPRLVVQNLLFANTC